MFDFTQPQKCSKCGSDEYTLFARTEGQGIRCMDCLHEKIVVSQQTKQHKQKFRVRMDAAWTAQKKRTTF